MLPQGNNIIPGGKLQQGLGYPKTDDDDRNFLKKLYYDNDVFDQTKGKSKKQSKNPPVAATKGLVRPSDVFPQ